MAGTYYQQTPLASNGKSKANGYYKDRNNPSSGGLVESAKSLWKKRQFDEWTFTLLLFLFSSSIVVGKLFLNHDSFSFLDNSSRFAVLNKNNSYFKDITDPVVIESLNKYGWLIKAAFSGMITTGITWFIIYEDSNVPGADPPSPFSPSKRRITESESPIFQINYLVGILNGLLVFLYMCL